MEPDNVVVGDLAHGAHFILKLLLHSLRRVPFDDLHSNSGSIHLSRVYISKLACICKTQFEVTEHFKLCLTFSDLCNICQRGERNCERFSLKSFK